MTVKTPQVKRCCTCKRDLLTTAFHKSRNTADGLHARCKGCRKIADAKAPQDPQRRRSTALMRLYGIDGNEYDRLHELQGGLCAICQRPERMTRKGVQRGLCVDHCHLTGKVRGLLCATCNVAIGKLQDDPTLLRAAAAYLER